MTTDEKILHLINVLIEQAAKFQWSRKNDPFPMGGWFTQYKEYFIHIYDNQTLCILGSYYAEFIPTSDLNTPITAPARKCLLSTVSTLYSNRQSQIYKVLNELSKL